MNKYTAVFTYLDAEGEELTNSTEVVYADYLLNALNQFDKLLLELNADDYVIIPE